MLLFFLFLPFLIVLIVLLIFFLLFLFFYSSCFNLSFSSLSCASSSYSFSSSSYSSSLPPPLPFLSYRPLPLLPVRSLFPHPTRYASSLRLLSIPRMLHLHSIPLVTQQCNQRTHLTQQSYAFSVSSTTISSLNPPSLHFSLAFAPF